MPKRGSHVVVLGPRLVEVVLVVPVVGVEVDVVVVVVVLYNKGCS